MYDPLKVFLWCGHEGRKHAHLLNHLSLVFNAEQGLKPQKVWTRKGASSLG